MEINKLDKEEFRRSRIPSFLVGAVFCGMSVLAAIDLYQDLAQGTTVAHTVVESLVVFLTLIAALTVGLMLLRESFEMRDSIQELTINLMESEDSADKWRVEAQSLLVGLGASIDRQFDAWQLTPVEKDIALFLLKGLSHKEVAYIRQVSHATVRQQARTVYRKAGVIGRHGLAAFFLEDLALPITGRGREELE